MRFASGLLVCSIKQLFMPALHLQLGKVEANVVITIRNRNLKEIRLRLIEIPIGAIQIIIVRVCNGFGAVPEWDSTVEVRVILPHITGRVRKLRASGVDANHLTE